MKQSKSFIRAKVAEQLYADAVRAGPHDYSRNFAAVFDHTSDRYFVGVVHINEAGNHIVAEQIAKLVDFGR